MQRSKGIFTLAIFCFISVTGFCQQFVSSGLIEYEVKTNMYKSIGSGTWEEKMKDNMSKFKTGYFTLAFNEKASLYTFNKWDASSKMPSYMLGNDEQNKYYADFEAGTYMMQKSLYGFDFLVKDSAPSITWKLENETQIIAGYTCRKATGIIMDSVYIFAFYSDEISAPTGPVSVGGLPGAILGLTIPRLYTSFIATKIIPAVKDAENIKPLSAKKTYSYNEIEKVLQERAKEWGNNDDGDNSMQRLIWNTML